MAAEVAAPTDLDRAEDPELLFFEDCFFLFTVQIVYHPHKGHRIAFNNGHSI